MITRGLKSALTANLEIIAGIQPISIRIKENVIKTALRLKLTRNWNKFCLLPVQQQRHKQVQDYN